MIPTLIVYPDLKIFWVIMGHTFHLSVTIDRICIHNQDIKYGKVNIDDCGNSKTMKNQKYRIRFARYMFISCYDLGLDFYDWLTETYC